MASDSNEAIEKSALHDWVESETRQLDVVASWESLCNTYKTLEFADQISDAVRMGEFKWIIAEMNKHLTRMRRKLLSCRNPEAMMEVLEKTFSPITSITSRQELAYQKLKQIWITQMLAKLETIAMQERMEEQNVGDEFWND